MYQVLCTILKYEDLAYTLIYQECRRIGTAFQHKYSAWCSNKQGTDSTAQLLIQDWPIAPLLNPFMLPWVLLYIAASTLPFFSPQMRSKDHDAMISVECCFLSQARALSTFMRTSPLLFREHLISRIHSRNTFSLKPHLIFFQISSCKTLTITSFVPTYKFLL